jgi:prepilin signal peptidase PulO-like enzyme (type II secretory pathway)
MMPALLVGGLGLLFGSFLNVVIFRVPAGRSLVAPPSACGGCGSRIRPRDNIPVLSWLLLRGRCRDCGVKISARYPLVELGTAVFFGLVAARLLTRPLGGDVATMESLVPVILTLSAFLYLAAVSVALTLIDIDTHTLPNRIVMPAYLVVSVLLAVASLLNGEPERLVQAAIGGGVLFGLYLLMALTRPGGMGLGDVKLAGVLGICLGWLGWGALAVGAFSAFLLGGVFALALVILGRANRKSGIPFGPWMLAGAWVGIFFGDQIAHGYLSLFGLV